VSTTPSRKTVTSIELTEGEGGTKLTFTDFGGVGFPKHKVAKNLGESMDVLAELAAGPFTEAIRALSAMEEVKRITLQLEQQQPFVAQAGTDAKVVATSLLSSVVAFAGHLRTKTERQRCRKSSKRCSRATS